MEDGREPGRRLVVKMETPERVALHKAIAHEAGLEFRDVSSMTCQLLTEALQERKRRRRGGK
jgi:hypothetical protein